MNLVIVSGPEATGKTAIAKAIAQRLGYQYQSKDAIKEALFDAQPRSTWHYAWYEKQAKAAFFKEIESFISQDESAVIESNFVAEDKQRLAADLNDTAALTEIFCIAKGFTSFWRFVRRNEAGARHKGHHDRRWYAKVLLQNLLGCLHIHWLHKPLGLTQKLLVVDTTDFAAVDYKKIVDFAEQG